MKDKSQQLVCLGPSKAVIEMVVCKRAGLTRQQSIQQGFDAPEQEMPFER